jgi:hypothetical protein
VRTEDIKPGELYAIWSGRPYHEPMPVVFLTAPADGRLYVQASRNPDGSSAFVKAGPGAEPRRGRWLGSGDTGYPVAQFRWGRGCARTVPDPRALLTVTLADFESSTSGHVGQVRIGVITDLGRVYGPWEQAVAQYDALRGAGSDEPDWMRAAWARSPGITGSR